MSIIYKIAYIILHLYSYTFRPATCGVLCLIECENKYLLIKNTYGSDIWKMPGGGIKKNENPERAIKREILEELSIKLIEAHHIKTIISTKEYKEDTVHLFYSKITYTNFVIDPKEIKTANWFNKDRLATEISNFVYQIIDSLKDTTLGTKAKALK